MVNHFIPGSAFIGCLIVAMYTMAQGREMQRKKPIPILKKDMNLRKKTLEELANEINSKYKPISDYEMK